MTRIVQQRRRKEIVPGQQIKNWTVIKEIDRVFRNDKPVRRALVRCACGYKKEMDFSTLFSPRAQYCKNCKDKLATDHGMSKSSEYQAWRHMLNRCYNPLNKSYLDYGGRGVTVCDRWNPDKGGCFQNFFNDLGPRPSSNHQIDKEIVDKENKIYAPGLAGWATREENKMRRRSTIYLDFCDKQITLLELSQEYKVPYHYLYERIVLSKRSAEDALFDFSKKEQKRRQLQ